MIINITDIEGARFPQSIELNKWVAEPNDIYAHFVGRMSVFNDTRSVALCSECRYKGVTQEDHDATRPVYFTSKELIVCDTFEELQAELKDEEERAALERRKTLRDTMRHIVAIEEYFADSSCEDDEELEKLIASTGDSDMFYKLCDRFRKKTKDRKLDECYSEALCMLKNRAISFRDRDHHYDKTSIPLDKITSVRLTTNYGKDCIAVNNGDCVYNIYEEGHRALFEVLRNIYII